MTRISFNILVFFLCGMVLPHTVAFQQQHVHYHLQQARTNQEKKPATSSRTAQLLATPPQHVLLEGMGLPSKPGWRSSGRLNRLTEWVGSKEANRPIICEYEPSGLWLWKRWQGTVLKMSKRSVVTCMVVGIFLDLLVRKHYSPTTSWPLLQVPPSSVPLIETLTGVKKLWQYQLSLATFIVTFFLSHAFGYWQKVYDTTRAIQGRINDICMLLSISAYRRNANTRDTIHIDTTTDKGYEEEVDVLIKQCTRLIRMSHTLFWAATPTASNGLTDCEEFLKDAAHCPLPIDDEHIGPLLLSPYGLRLLVNSEQLTQEEAEDLIASKLPPTQYAYVLLVWAGCYIMDGVEQGLFQGGPGLEGNLLSQLTTLRARMFDIDDFRAGRMPLAYVQLVQVLVDSLIILSPFALYAELGSLSIPLVGLLTLFFRGLLKLSKSFLDPFGVEGFGDQNIRVDVLVSELNFGASKRWTTAGSFLPTGSTGVPPRKKQPKHLPSVAVYHPQYGNKNILSSLLGL